MLKLLKNAKKLHFRKFSTSSEKEMPRPNSVPVEATMKEHKMSLKYFLNAGKQHLKSGLKSACEEVKPIRKKAPELIMTATCGCVFTDFYSWVKSVNWVKLVKRAPAPDEETPDEETVDEEKTLDLHTKALERHTDAINNHMASVEELGRIVARMNEREDKKWAAEEKRSREGWISWIR